jgi:hypothetical protein
MNRVGSSQHEPFETRFGELSKLLPVFFVLSLIVVLYIVYIFLHCVPALQLDLPDANRDQAEASRGMWEMIFFHCDTALLMYCFVCCILIHPGTIPNTPEWQLHQDSPEIGQQEKRLSTIETKHTGERRHCKWCMRYKPDRCHHCRVCNTCILRMDHHCPWIYNCVGYRNHKYFFLLLFYSCIDLHFIVFTMFHSTQRATRTDVPFSLMFLLIFGETLASFLAVLVTAFFFFHIWLMMKAMTTIEFCEKSLKKADYDSSLYHKGPFGNMCEVMGPVPMFWLCPWSVPEGTGLSWVDEKTSLMGQASSSSSPAQRRASALAVDAAATSSGGFAARRSDELESEESAMSGADQGR